MDPVTNENTGGRLGQPTGAQHAVAVTLSVVEAAFVHLSASVPTHTHIDRNRAGPLSVHAAAAALLREVSVFYVPY